MPFDKAEKLFCQIALNNKLATQADLDLLAKEVKSSGNSLPDVAQALHIIHPPAIKKIVEMVTAKGLLFSKAWSTDTQDPHHEPHFHKVELSHHPQKVSPPVHTESPHVHSASRVGLMPTPKPLEKGKGAALMQALEVARKNLASDFHIVVNTPPFMRRYGEIVKMGEHCVTAQESEAMLFDALSEIQKAKLRKNLALDFCLIGSDNSRYRANIVQEKNGWTGSFRIINKEPPSIEALGLPESVKKLTDYQQGLVLITGPKGCGKTTTMAALVNLINETRKDHIITVEDPIEYIHPSKKCQVTQRALGVDTLSFANALRGALREDPDIIMVGELRDLETISTSITASETGHLVLASINTTSAMSTINRIVDSFPAKQQSQIRVMIAASIRGVVCQQLLPRADGQGVVMAIEVMLNNIGVRKTIMEEKTFMLDNIIQISEREGMIRMDDSIRALLKKGLITIETAREYCRDPKKMEV